MIVSFDSTYDGKFSNINLFENFSEFYIRQRSLEYASGFDFNLEFQKSQFNIKKYYVRRYEFDFFRIAWKINDNDYIGDHVIVERHINNLKKTKWYINYMRILKLKRILENKYMDLESILSVHIKNGITPFRGLKGNGELVVFNHIEKNIIMKLLTEGKTIMEIVSLYQHGKLINGK